MVVEKYTKTIQKLQSISDTVQSERMSIKHIRFGFGFANYQQPASQLSEDTTGLNHAVVELETMKLRKNAVLIVQSKKCELSLETTYAIRNEPYYHELCKVEAK